MFLLASFPLSAFLLIPSITSYSISISSLTPRHSTNRFSFILYRKIFEAFDGETIAAMDPESFAEYLGSQSLIDMMASAGAGAGTGTGASASAGAAAGKEGDRDTDTVTTHTSHHVST